MLPRHKVGCLIRGIGFRGIGQPTACQVPRQVGCWEITVVVSGAQERLGLAT